MADSSARTQKEGEAVVTQLLAQLDQWMRAHRADLYKKLNPPATDAELQQLEAQSGKPLPPGLKALLKWHNGQPANVLDTFHPLTNEMFVSSGSMLETMRDMNELARFGDIDAESWSKTWLPFMDNGGGNMSVLDPETGQILSRDHETQEITQTHASFEDWLQELVGELLTNNFAEWDIKESRGH